MIYVGSFNREGRKSIFFGPPAAPTTTAQRNSSKINHLNCSTTRRIAANKMLTTFHAQNMVLQTIFCSLQASMYDLFCVLKFVYICSAAIYDWLWVHGSFQTFDFRLLCLLISFFSPLLFACFTVFSFLCQFYLFTDDKISLAAFRTTIGFLTTAESVWLTRRKIGKSERYCEHLSHSRNLGATLGASLAGWRERMSQQFEENGPKPNQTTNFNHQKIDICIVDLSINGRFFSLNRTFPFCSLSLSLSRSVAAMFE